METTGKQRIGPPAVRANAPAPRARLVPGELALARAALRGRSRAGTRRPSPAPPDVRAGRGAAKKVYEDSRTPPQVPYLQFTF